MTKAFLLLFSVFLIGCLILIGCTNQQLLTSVSPGTSKSASPSSNIINRDSSSSGVIKMKMGIYHAAASAIGSECKLLIQQIEKTTGDRVQIDLYPSEELGKEDATLDMLKSGVCDIATLSQPAFPALFTFLQGFELPMFLMPSGDAATEIRESLFAKGFTQGYENLHFLAFTIQRGQLLWTHTRVTRAEDLKGLKIRWPDPAILEPFQSFGVIPVVMDRSDEYMSLQRGVIDGLNGAPETITDSRFQEVVKYGLLPPISYGGMTFVMSKTAWDKLPPDIQTEITQAIALWRPQAIQEYKDREKASYQILSQAGVEIVNIDPAEVRRWQQLAIPIVNGWIAKRAAEGYPAQQYIDTIREMAKQYSSKSN